MDILKTTPVQAARAEVIDHLLSEDYDAALIEGIEAIASIQQTSRVQHDARKLERVMRYGAATAARMPSFLSKYRDKAPEFVYWEQHEVWNLSDFTMRYTIRADIKPEWQKYYSTHGELTLRALSPTRTEIVASLTYRVNVFGLSRLIEKALHEEVSKILTTQGALTAKRFS